MTRWTAPWWRTLLLALLLFGGLASAIAVQGPDEVTTTAPAPGVAWPEALAFAAPHLGDHAQYDVRWNNATTGNVTGEDRFEFTLPHAVNLPGPDGLPRDYVALHTEGSLGGMDGRGGTWKAAGTDFEALDPATGLVAVRFVEGPSNDGQDGCSGECPEHATSYKRQVRHHGPDYAGRTPCGVFHAFQGRTVSPAGWNGTLLGPCAWFGAEAPTFAVSGLGVDNETLLLVHATNETRREVWLHPEVPYPVRLVTHWLRHDAVQTVTLSGLHRGETPLPKPGPVPSLPLAPATPTGPDEAGVEHPYPLSRAWEDARADARVARWLDEHPGTYLRAAYHAREEDDANRTTWRTAWSDGEASLWVNVTAVDSPEPEAGPPDPFGLLGGDESGHAVEVEVAPRDAVGDPRPEQVPRAVPSVATLWMRWQAARDGEASPNGWGYEVYCVDDCAEARTYLTAGVDLRFRRGGEGPSVSVLGQSTREPVESGRVEDAYGVALDADGSILWARFDRDVTALHDAPEPPGGAVEPLAVPAQARAEPTARLVTVEVWQWPDPAVTAALSGLALLLVALHHFSPGLVRLFSRVRHHDALDHPLRRALLDAVASEPGIHARALARCTGQARGTVTHHLRKLEETGHVRSRTEAGLRCYVAVGVERGVARASPLLHKPSTRGILSLLADGPVDGVSALARAVGLSPSTCHHHVGRLEAAGLVEATRGRGRRGRIALTAHGEAVLSGLPSPGNGA